jgi:hypothetical protein
MKCKSEEMSGREKQRKRKILKSYMENEGKREKQRKTER